MTKEPLWRALLNWGAVFYFLFIPGIVLAFAVFHLGSVEPARVSFISNFHYAVTAIVAAMAGLNSWDKKNGAKRNGAPETPPPPKKLI